MAKFVSDQIIDNGLSYLEDNADQLVLCNGEPSTYADATTDSGSGGNALGEIAVTSADFTIADGDVSGRKITVAAQSGITADVSGTCDHFAIVNDTSNELLLVTTLASSESLTSGNTYDTESFKDEIEDAA